MATIGSAAGLWHGQSQLKHFRPTKSTQNICCWFKATIKLVYAFIQAIKCAYHFQQDKDSSNKHREDFDAYIMTMESYRSQMGVATRLVGEEIKASVTDQDIPMANEMDAQLMVRNKLLAYVSVGSANNKVYQNLQNKLVNDYAKRVHNYPSTADNAVDMINAYKVGAFH